MAKRKKKLVTQRARFVREYVKDYNGQAAAIRAGYSEQSARSQASRLLDMPDVKAELEQVQKRVLERLEMDAASILKRLEELSDEARGREDFGPAIRAIELIGKHLGMFVDRREVTGKGGGPLEYRDVSGMTDEEIDAEIARLRAEE